MNEYGFTLGLALEDFVPVIFFATGLYFLARMTRQMQAESGRLALFGAVLITLGGLSKATWKLIVASNGPDIQFLDNLLFIFLAPGFILLGWAIFNAQSHARNGREAQQLWLFPLILIALVYAGAWFVAGQGGRSWFFILLGMTTLANVAVSFMVIQHAWQEDMKLMALLFFVNILLVFVLSGLARVPEQTASLQWVEQGINTVSTGAFAFAAYRLANVVSERGAFTLNRQAA